IDTHRRCARPRAAYGDRSMKSQDLISIISEYKTVGQASSLLLMNRQEAPPHFKMSVATNHVPLMGRYF
ncbi:MAG: hypothetical protein WBG50_21490, partial [Desulfomonilaceae bacterium]